MFKLTRNHHNGLNNGEDYDAAFLEHLKAERDTVLGECAGQAARDIFDKIVNDYAEKHALKKAAVYAADRARLEMISAAELRAEAPGLYRRFCEERGDPVDPADPAMKRPTPEKPDNKQEIDALRARLLEVLRALHWSYTFGPLREKKRVGLIIEAMVVMLVATAALGAMLGIVRQLDGGQGHPFMAVLATVVYAGVMGGVASCMQRLSAVPTRGDALGSIYALKNSRYVLYFAPLTGAVFAVITMLLFMGQILKGLIFPAFPDVVGTGPASGEWVFTHLLLPASSKDYALLFLWCFVAGFAERFIPDTLTDLAQRASSARRREAGSTTTTINENTVVNPPRNEAPTTLQPAAGAAPGSSAPANVVQPQAEPAPSSGTGEAPAAQPAPEAGTTTTTINENTVVNPPRNEAPTTLQPAAGAAPGSSAPANVVQPQAEPAPSSGTGEAPAAQPAPEAGTTTTTINENTVVNPPRNEAPTTLQPAAGAAPGSSAPANVVQPQAEPAPSSGTGEAPAAQPAPERVDAPASTPC